MEAAQHNCPYCPKKYVREINLTRHINEKHNVVSQIMNAPLPPSDFEEHEIQEMIAQIDKLNIQEKRHQNYTRDADKYALIQCEIINDKVKFTIVNVRDNRNNNDVKITLSQEKIFCSCSDFKFRCNKAGVMCKHVLYVFMTILRYNKERLDCVDNLKFKTQQDFQVFIDASKNLHINRQNGARRFEGTDFSADGEIDEDHRTCAICYMDYEQDEIERKLQVLCKCPECRQFFHIQCMKIWINRSTYKNCVNCRSDIWKKFK